MKKAFLSLGAMVIGCSLGLAAWNFSKPVASPLHVPEGAGVTVKIAQEIMTNPPRGDGFGAQFQTIIYSVIYAELNNKKFVYTPFKEMEHNYDNDPKFLAEKEELINFIGNFDLSQDPSLQPKMRYDLHAFFEGNLEACVNSQSLKKIKAVFRANKNRKDYFDHNNLHIAVHVRRPNPHDSRIEGSDINDSIYLEIINLLRNIHAKEKPLFHLYSQGDVNLFKQIYGANDVVLHINEPVEKTFTSMVFADVLVTTSSSLSYTAGILSEGRVYYIPFWHPPLPGWTAFKFKEPN